MLNSTLKKKHLIFFFGKGQKSNKNFVAISSRCWNGRFLDDDETRLISIGAGVYLSWSCVDGRYFKGDGMDEWIRMVTGAAGGTKGTHPSYRPSFPKRF